MSYNLLLNSSMAMRAAAIFTAARPDIVLGAAIWSIKCTCDGIFYLFFKSNKNENKIEINKDILDKLIDKSESQEIEIKKLSDNINILTDYIKNNNQINT